MIKSHTDKSHYGLRKCLKFSNTKFNTLRLISLSVKIKLQLQLGPNKFTWKVSVTDVTFAVMKTNDQQITKNLSLSGWYLNEIKCKIRTKRIIK